MKSLFFSLLCFFVCQMGISQSTYILKGAILNQKNKPIENVHISIKNTNIGTVTNTKGAFEIESTELKITLLVSTANFKKKEIKVTLHKNKETFVKIQLNGTTHHLEEVVINSNKSGIESTFRATQEKHKSIAGGTNVVSMKRLESQRSFTLKDALQQQPGVIIQEFFGANDQPRLNIRGSGIQSNPQRRGVELLQNGITTNFSDGSYIIAGLEPQTANHIEVFRGANALKYGSATLGGAINLISKNGYTATPLNVKIEGGSFNYFGGNISTGFAKDNNDLYVALSYGNSKGFRQHNTSSKMNALLNFGRKFNDDFESRVYINYTNLKFDIPGPVTQKQLENDSKQISKGVNPPISLGPNVVRDKPGRASSIFRISNKLVYKLDENNHFNLGLQYQYSDDKFMYPAAVGVRDSKSNDFYATLSFDSKTEKNNFSVGIMSSTGHMNRRYFVNIEGAKGKEYATNKLVAINITFYAEDIYKFTDRLSGVASVQLSRNYRDNTDNFENPVARPFYNFKTKTYGTFASKNTSLNQSYYGISPKIGVIYTVADKQLFFNVSRSYEPPTFDELLVQSKGNPNKSPELVKSVKLDAQTATTVEIGTRGAFKKINWDVSFYNSWVKNEILTTTDLFGISGSTRNSPDQTIHQGVEFGADAVLLSNIFSQDNDQLKWNTVYNYSRFYFDGGIYKNKQIAGVPRHHIASSLVYTYNGFFTELNTEWIPEDTPTDHQNTVFQKAYQLFGARVGFQENKWGIFVEGRNLTNIEYASSYLIRDVVINPPPAALTPKNVTTFIPGTGVNFSIGINYKL